MEREDKIRAIIDAVKTGNIDCRIYEELDIVDYIDDDGKKWSDVLDYIDNNGYVHIIYGIDFYDHKVPLSSLLESSLDEILRYVNIPETHTK
ncbi:MAG: hypothetical protein K6B75_08410 [Lachnospiraceae bacterium]|nr:hypothetical protein [Lachnospiraceae bacterium]